MKSITSKDGTRIAFDQSGEGPALILVAAAAMTRAEEASLAAALAPYFNVFAYDRRARGDSGDTRPYAVEREVEDLAAVIAVAGGSAFVYGHSSGAVLALEAARLLATQVTKLALYEPPFIIDATHAPQPEEFAVQLDTFVAAGQQGDAVGRWMAFMGIPVEGIAHLRQTPMWPRMEALAQSLVYDATIMQETQQGSPAPLKQWASVAIPTLVLDGTLMMGSEDLHAFMRHGVDALAAVLPNAQRRILEGQDHGPADEVLAPALREFFIG